MTVNCSATTDKAETECARDDNAEHVALYWWGYTVALLTSKTNLTR